MITGTPRLSLIRGVIDMLRETEGRLDRTRKQLDSYWKVNNKILISLAEARNANQAMQTRMTATMECMTLAMNPRALDELSEVDAVDTVQRYSDSEEEAHAALAEDNSPSPSLV